MTFTLKEMIQNPSRGCNQIKYMISEQCSPEELPAVGAAQEVIESLAMQTLVNTYQKEMRRYEVGENFINVGISEAQEALESPVLTSVISSYNDATLESTLN